MEAKDLKISKKDIKEMIQWYKDEFTNGKPLRWGDLVHGMYITYGNDHNDAVTSVYEALVPLLVTNLMAHKTINQWVKDPHIVFLLSEFMGAYKYQLEESNKDAIEAMEELSNKEKTKKQHIEDSIDKLKQ